MLQPHSRSATFWLRAAWASSKAASVPRLTPLPLNRSALPTIKPANILSACNGTANTGQASARKTRVFPTRWLNISMSIPISMPTDSTSPTWRSLLSMARTPHCRSIAPAVLSLQPICCRRLFRRGSTQVSRFSSPSRFTSLRARLSGWWFTSRLRATTIIPSDSARLKVPTSATAT